MAKYIIQFNEANFDLCKRYCDKYSLPNLQKLIDSSTYINTNSEEIYENLEPWIQWYSFYTGLSYKQHNVFHLGDCLKSNHSNFLKDASHGGQDIGIFGGMNLPFDDTYKIFIPDAWTEAKTDKSFSSKLVSSALKNLVNSNARLKISYKDIAGLILLIGLPRKLTDISIIFKVLISFVTKSRSSLASYFDYFFLKYSLNRAKNSNLDLSLIFLNGFAHIQHHYMFSSEFVEGSNPSWYASDDRDLLLESLYIYDKSFGLLLNTLNKGDEYFVLTGLTQEPYKEPFIYWRLRSPEKIFSKFLLFNFKINPRMTRDFELVVDNNNNISEVIKFLNNAEIKDGVNVYKAFGDIHKNSNNSVFASFVYSNLNNSISLHYGDKKLSIDNDIDFIAIKNAGHDQRGWFISNKKLINDNIDIWNASKLIS
jgi:hypothetical protein